MVKTTCVAPPPAQEIICFRLEPVPEPVSCLGSSVRSTHTLLMYVKIVQPCGEIRSIYEEAAGFMSELISLTET